MVKYGFWHWCIAWGVLIGALGLFILLSNIRFITSVISNTVLLFHSLYLWLCGFRVDSLHDMGNYIDSSRISNANSRLEELPNYFSNIWFFFKFILTEPIRMMCNVIGLLYYMVVIQFVSLRALRSGEEVMPAVESVMKQVLEE